VQLRQAAQAVRDYDEDALRRCLSNLLPEFALRADPDADEANVISISRNQA
jgi:hypothetical protein